MILVDYIVLRQGTVCRPRVLNRLSLIEVNLIKFKFIGLILNS